MAKEMEIEIIWFMYIAGKWKKSTKRIRGKLAQLGMRSVSEALSDFSPSGAAYLQNA